MHENCVSKEEFEKLLKYVHELEARLAKYENAHTPPSMRINNYPKREKTGNPVGKPKGAPGGTRKLEHQKSDETISLKPEKCRKCKFKLGEPIGWIKHLVQEIPDGSPGAFLGNIFLNMLVSP
ncbi:MAG: hypothetical protein V1870_02565 [Candidatus Aenigmatarchaeota archaeon]